MKIAFGSDHAGYELKKSLTVFAKRLGAEVKDFGTDSIDSCDYPDSARAVAAAVSEGTFDFGVLVCGSGIGMSIAANKFPRVRAALACSIEHARLARLHNDANILCLGARFIDDKIASECLKIFLETKFEGGRHEKRVAKISALEKDLSK
ncbi:MAG: ribose 5-phosphate isomerase B [Elusimicrobia bacterium HGW-Elusimicrobia-1]|jgi:ribose 5-phosphate isomerase B|nr:MAG: ribose 5-phosphate isomerase B [Elusimicrobia bacterium HGW-Elusimicrobia-1]